MAKSGARWGYTDVACFGSVLWSSVLKGKCSEWVGGSAEKVIAGKEYVLML